MKSDAACVVNSLLVVIIFESIGHNHKNVIEKMITGQTPLFPEKIIAG